MSVQKRTGFDWQCEAANCQRIESHHSDHTLPDGFVLVRIKRGLAGDQTLDGHACSGSCAGTVAQALYAILLDEPQPDEPQLEEET